MRWKAPKYHSLGDLRHVRKFLILPRTIQGEVRWLEMATITQQFKVVERPLKGGWIKCHRWVNVAWVNK